MDRKFRVFTLFLSRLLLVQAKRSVKVSRKAATVVILAIGLSLGGAVSARAFDIGQLLRDIVAISNSLSQGLQTFTGIQNVPVGTLDLPTTQETQQAITNLFGQGNPQANANNLVNSITSSTAASIANKKIWSQDGQKKQTEIADEGIVLDKASYDAAGYSRDEADSVLGKDSSQEILKSISQQLKQQAFISDDQSRLLVIQNSLLQESNLQTSAANGSTASTQEMISGQAKKKNIEEQDQLIGDLVSIERSLRE
jgi:hypothetical protein